MKSGAGEAKFRLPRRVMLRDGSGPVVIRRAKASDAPAVLEYTRALHEGGEGVIRYPDELDESEKRIARRIRKATRGEKGVRGLELIAELDGRVVGDVSVRRYEPRRLRHIGHLGVGVRPGMQGKGLGRALMELVIEWARAQGDIRRLDLFVFADNARAIALYESLGFVREGVRVGFLREDDGTSRDDVGMAMVI